MRLHQVLTGAANTSENGVASLGYGCIEDYPFIVYSSGCDVVILDSTFQRVQIVTKQCATSNHIGLISCSETDGKVAVAHGRRIRIFAPKSTTTSVQNKSLPFQWTLVNEFLAKCDLNCLVWDREGKRLLTGGQFLELWTEDHIDSNDKCRENWRNVWQCETANDVHHVHFSSDGMYFASLGKDDCLVKVWYEIEKDYPSVKKNKVEQIFYDFLYIVHPQPVIGFSWRKTSPFMPKGSVANVLLTSCADNVCRIWCETMEFDNHYKPTRGVTSPRVDHSCSGSTSSADHHFHIAATIDPTKDIPIMSTVSYFTSGKNHSFFVIHWVNNKEMYMTSIVNILLGSPSVYMEAESEITSSEHITHSPYDILHDDDLDDNDILKDQHLNIEHDTDHDSTVPLAYSSPTHENGTLNPSLDRLQQFDTLLREWQSTPDSLLAINPADGSLLVWLVESLDVVSGTTFRQTQVSFSSCIPSVFPSADAHSLLHNLILYRTPGKLSLQTPTASDQPNFYFHGRPKSSTHSQACSKFQLVSMETGAHPPVAMISTHKDGSMNQWQIDFADNTAFSTLISMSHLTRLSGHRFPLTGMFPHPSLPLLLSVSTFSPRDCGTDAQEEGASTFSYSELILWQCHSVFPLSQNSGIMELAKITSTEPNAFNKITWLPKLFINSLVTFDSTVAVSPRSMSPCACFIASEDTGLRLYQVVLDGRALLDFLSGKQDSRRVYDRSYSLTSDDGEDINPDYPAVSSVHRLLHCVVSDQSGAKPGSVLKLSRIKSSQDVLKDPLFLHVFSQQTITGCGNTGCFTSEESWGEDAFYLVALDNDGTPGGNVVTWVHMWIIEVTASYEDSSQGVSSCECGDLDTTKCGVRTRKILTTQLSLPDSVHVTLAKASANTLSAVSENKSCRLPHLISTLCSDNIMRFWTCRFQGNHHDDSCDYTWFEPRYRIDVASGGVPIAMDCASTGRVAMVTSDSSVTIWESESSGNTEWVIEDVIDITGSKSTIEDAVVRWFSCENGSFVLAVAVHHVLYLYSLHKTDDMQMSEKSHCYCELLRIPIHSCTEPSKNGIFVSFVRRGLLIVGIGYEVHVYSQWGNDKCVVASNDTTSVLQCVHETNTNPGLLNEVLRRNPILPQYHPKYLTELLDFGKLRRVRAILNHLVRCVAGDEAMHVAVWNDGERSRTRSIISTLNRTSSLSSTPVDTETQSHRSEVVNCIPPMAISDLLNADNDDTGNSFKNQENVQQTEHAIVNDSEEKNYSELFSTSFKNSFDSSDPTPESNVSVTHVKPAISPVHFGLAQAGLLAEYLTRKQLPRLTRTEQLELQALADTVATTKSDLEESSSEIDRGMKFARMHNSGNTGFMGGPSGGGGGYATTGSIGATEGSGGDAVDDCGLRFLLALRHHTCLLRSLPFKQRSQLERQGLSSSKFVWAFHSDSQEELLAMLPGMIRGEPTWEELRQYGVGWWIKSNETLKRLIEKVAKAQFNAKQDPMDCLLFYMAMKKKTVIRGLFRTQGDVRMGTFFNNNFNEERWRKAALKNAYSLLSKQRFAHAAAFFLLADALWDAVQLCINRLQDVQLALVLCRLYDNDDTSHHKILEQRVLGCDEDSCSAKKDPFLRSVAYWLVKKYHQALRTLLLEPGPDTDHIEGKYNKLAAQGTPDIFNFYVYLRTHPLLRRSRFQMHSKADQSQRRTRLQNLSRQQSMSEAMMAPSPLTSFERRLYFMTAHNHYNAGCPDLSLQVLLELPQPVEQKQDDSQKSVVEDVVSLSGDDHMISTGTIDWSKPITTKAELNTSDFDWGRPVSTKLGGSGASNDIGWSQPISEKLGSTGAENGGGIDWGRPVSTKLGGSGASNDIDWSQPISEKLGGTGAENGIDWGQPVSTKLGGTGITRYETGSNKPDNGKPGNENGPISEDLTNCNGLDSSEDMQNGKITSKNDLLECDDTAAQRLKFNACLKLLVEELCTLPHHCQIHNKDLRLTFNTWLKKELELLHRICENNIEGVVTDELVPLKVSTPTTLEQGSEEILNELVNDVNSEKVNVAQKIEKSAKHIEWLKENQTLLNILLNYCTLHGASGGDVATMKVELLILIHELEQQRHLMSPLYLRSAGSSIPPLILATMVSSFSLGSSSFSYLSAMTQDILKYLIKLPGPPSPSQPLDMVHVLRSLSATLSACVLQSLVYDKDEGDQGGSRVPSPVSHSSATQTYHHKTRPTSQPGQWPGVHLLRSLLITEAKDNATKLKVLLTEICISVYLSLLSIALHENDPNQLYYIICNNLTPEMWALTFGGGRKIKEQSIPGPADDDSKRQMTSAQQRTYWEAARRRWNYKLLQTPAKENEKKTKEHEVFIPPQTTLMEYFLRKPNTESRKEMSFDSEAESSSESEFEDDDPFDKDDERIVRMPKPKKIKPTDHLDSECFSWRLMHYAVANLVCQNVNTFLADVGLEISDLPAVSPLLHSVIKMLQHWQQVLFLRLKKGEEPPSDYVSLFTMMEHEYSRGGPTLMKYKALIDPNNTPFRSTSSSANAAKRLWYTLVHREELQKIFIEFVFGQEDQPSTKLDTTDSGDENTTKILHKDSEAINSFCMSETNPSRVVVATMRDVQEIDISSIISRSRSSFLDESFPSELDKSDPKEFGMTFNATSSEITQSPLLGSNPPEQTGAGSSVILKRNVSGVKRMESHPSLPYYLTGGHDGSLRMWEFGHEPAIAVYRDSGKYQRVTNVHFSHHGNKFGVIDFGGQLALHQTINTSNTAAFVTLKCHSKHGNDFTFLGSTSVVATAGHSSDNSNICFWDTLLPAPNNLIHGFICHENGSPCVVYVPGKQLLLSGGRKGDICIIDVRQRRVLHTFTAHDSDVKTIAVDESEEYFVSGSLDGDIKVWNLSAHEELVSFPGIHGRSNYQLIKIGTQGVPKIHLKPGGEMFSCGGDGTLKWKQLPNRYSIGNTL